MLHVKQKEKQCNLTRSLEVSLTKEISLHLLICSEFPLFPYTEYR